MAGKAMRTRCKDCGEMFSQSSKREVRCKGCRRPKRARYKPPSREELFRRWVANEEARWKAWALERLEPFLGQPWMNDVIARFNGKPVATADEKEHAA